MPLSKQEAVVVADATGLMIQILDEFNWPYKGVPGQLPCPIHKAGTEKSYSARIYDDNRIFCYTCGTQFPPSEIYAALAGMSREAAAEEILYKWPPTKEEQTKALKEYTTPRKKPIPVALLDNARNHLLKYRHKVPLLSYRDWAIRLVQLESVLSEASKEEQPRKLSAFKQTLTRELEATRPEK